MSYFLCTASNLILKRRRNKAVAEGAISYYIDRLVSTRVSRFTFGIEVTRAFDSADKEHLKRASQVYTAPSGHLRLQGVFSEILGKVRSFSFAV
jgi:hypothetical protein